MYTIDEIHNSLLNGQREQMVDMINAWGLYDFWSDYRDYLTELYEVNDILVFFSNAVISYHRIMNR